MTTRTSPPPQIIYWRNRSPESDSLAEALRADSAEGQLNLVETPDQFKNAVKQSRTQLIVTHDPNMTGDVLKDVQSNCPDAVVVLVCEDEGQLSPEIRDAVSHLVSAKQLAQSLPALKRVLRQSSRLWTVKDSHVRNCADVLSVVQDAVIVQTPNGTIASWNPAAERMFGWTDAEALGRHKSEVLTQIAGANEAEIAEALETTSTWAGEILYRGKNNRETYVFSRRRQTRNGNGRINIVEVCADRTAAKRDERDAKLLESLRVLLRIKAPLAESMDQAAKRLVVLGDACLIDLQNDDGAVQRSACATGPGAPVPITTLLPQLREDYPVFSSNRSTAGDVLRTGQTAIVSPVSDVAAFLGVIHAPQKERLADVPIHAALVAPVLYLEKPIGLITILSANRAHTFSDADKQILSRAGAIVGAAFERVRGELRLSDARAQSQSAIYLKDAFLGTVSHELRTPLQSMLGWTHLLRENQLAPPEVERALNSLEDSIKAQGKIVNELLEVSRINSGKLDLAPRPVELKPLVEQTLRAFDTSASSKQLQIALSGWAAPLWVNADVTWLQRALSNVLSNAVKFTPIGGKVTVDISTEGEMAAVHVIDTGVGIAPDHLPRLFQFFTQADSSTTRAHHGLGIGLAVARHVIEAHGGTVEAFSRGLGKGTSVSMHVPLCNPPERAPVAGSTGARKEPSQPPAGGEESSLSGMCLLLVEDEIDTRELLAVALRQAGADVIEAGNAADALRMVKAKRFDIIVSDIGMPQEDGCSLIRKIRALPEEQGGHTPALALTAYASREDRLNALRAGFQVHMPKPVDISELLLTLKSLAASIQRPVH